mmetsp:Transcript_79429/g.182071  ORF Transcript_79429/g.182071 Transcript_79429/m.182071 type:complete len:248 (+) Transcript_79429:50-793(+)
MQTRTKGVLGIPTPLITRGSTSGLVGSLLGIMISLVVNCTLVEISLSAFFSLYFGVLFMSVGVLILYRIQQGPNPGELPPDAGGTRKAQLTVFALIIILSGVLCFVLERNWFVALSPVSKVPLYSLLGVAVAFALTFSIMDLLNYVLGFLQGSSSSKPLLASASQVTLVLCVALVMGACYGFVFGLMDVEDEVSYQIRLALLREEHYCFPIGAVLGGIGGVGNEYIRYHEDLSTRHSMKGLNFDRHF